MPHFKYFLSNRKNPVREGDFVWSTPIPLGRHESARTIKSDDDIFINHGDCFLAARDFLEKNRCAIIAQSVSQHLHRNIAPEEIEEIRIFIDKHGEFYHPAKIEVVLHGTTLPFVLNVAISDTGKQCVERECQLLKQLNKDYPLSFVPNVYGQGSFLKKNGLFGIRMFLGEWFEGFNEFHISFESADEKYKIVVWDHTHGNYFLTTEQTVDLYRQAAKILTYYYNVSTFEQISAWHHGAGDFVLKCQNDDIHLKLITVRQYRSIFENNIGIDHNSPDAEWILEALLVFFLNMAIKMRIDRLDGVGKIVWSDEIALNGILKGFFDGLALKPPIPLFSKPLTDVFRKHLLACTQTDLQDLNRSIVQTYHPQAEEMPVMRRHIEKHVDDLYQAIKKLK